MTVRRRNGIRFVVCDEAWCRSMLVTEDTEAWHVAGHGNGATHKCPQDRSAMEYAEKLERERRAG